MAQFSRVQQLYRRVPDISTRCCSSSAAKKQVQLNSTGGSNSGKDESVDLRNWSSDECQFLHKSYVPTMRFQRSLLRLKIPELNKTCSRYLLSQRALLSDAEYLETKKAVEDFKEITGPSLNKELQAQDQANPRTNYVAGPWFDMYLKDRVPLVLNYNPFLGFLPPQPHMTDPVIRASNMVVSSARFLRTLRARVLEPEVYHINPAKSDTQFFRRIIPWVPHQLASYAAYAQKAFPLDMSQFENLFNSTRIPQLSKDTFSKTDDANHILFIKNGHFYVFDILDQNGVVHPPSHIHACIAHIAADRSPRAQHPLGYLTSENRDVWAKVRQELVSAGNEQLLELIDHAAFAVVLDDAVVGNDADKCYRTFLYGDAGNRWFDKSFSVLFAADGNAALNFEHGWGDGVAVMRYFNEVSRDCQKTVFVGDQAVPADVDTNQLVWKLEFTLTDSIKAAVSAAKEKYEAATSALAVDVLESSIMSKAFCKKHKVSPDAVMQLGFQLAYRLQYGGTAATYESCSTSAFKHGRTETVRPATFRTSAFCDAVTLGGGEDLGDMVRLCSRKHFELTKEAAMGQGFDRHLFCLRKLAEKSGDRLPALFQDPAYAKINHNIISTSTLPSDLISIGGFAPVVKDGFGVGYQINDDRLGIVLSSYPPHRDGAGFIECADKAYTIIRDALAS